jgi:hypothetical protein
MAIFNEILVGRYNRALQKLFGIKGPPPVRQIAGEISPSVGMFYGVENRFTEAWDVFENVVSQAGVAAQDSRVMLRNPAGQNVFAVVESILISNVNAAVQNVNVELGTFGANLATVAQTLSLDGRQRRQSSALISFANSVPPGVFAFLRKLPALAAGASIELMQYENQEYPLAPGDGLQIRTVELNVFLRISIRWRERFLEESERT